MNTTILIYAGRYETLINREWDIENQIDGLQAKLKRNLKEQEIVLAKVDEVIRKEKP